MFFISWREKKKKIWNSEGPNPNPNPNPNSNWKEKTKWNSERIPMLASEVDASLHGNYDRFIHSTPWTLLSLPLY